MLDLTKPVQTRDGRKVRILCTDKSSGRTDRETKIVALVTSKELEVEEVLVYFSNGRFLYNSEYKHDLVNVPEVLRVPVYLCKSKFNNVAYIGLIKPSDKFDMKAIAIADFGSAAEGLQVHGLAFEADMLYGP